MSEDLSTNGYIDPRYQDAKQTEPDLVLHDYMEGNYEDAPDETLNQTSINKTPRSTDSNAASNMACANSMADKPGPDPELLANRKGDAAGAADASLEQNTGEGITDTETGAAPEGADKDDLEWDDETKQWVPRASSRLSGIVFNVNRDGPKQSGTISAGLTRFREASARKHFDETKQIAQDVLNLNEQRLRDGYYLHKIKTAIAKDAKTKGMDPNELIQGIRQREAFTSNNYVNNALKSLDERYGEAKIDEYLEDLLRSDVSDPAKDTAAFQKAVLEAERLQGGRKYKAEVDEENAKIAERNKSRGKDSVGENEDFLRTREDIIKSQTTITNKAADEKIKKEGAEQIAEKDKKLSKFHAEIIEKIAAKNAEFAEQAEKYIEDADKASIDSKQGMEAIINAVKEDLAISSADSSVKESQRMKALAEKLGNLFSNLFASIGLGSKR